MSFIAGIALVLLTLVGYSSGSVIGAGGRAPAPRILDLLVLIVLWVAALATRGALGKWSAILVWLAAGLVVGAILARLRMDTYPQAAPPDTGPGPWNAWKRFAQRMGNYQSRVLMAFLYFSVVLPFGLGVTLLGDPLRIRWRCRQGQSGAGSNWQAKESPLKPSLEEAREQS